MEYLWMSNKLVIIRVLYTAERDKPDAWEELRSISVDDVQLENGEKPTSCALPEPGEEFLTRYNLVSYVALMKEGDPQSVDVFRSYSTDGEPIHCPDNFDGTDSVTVLGQAGTSYMLFYALALPCQRSSPSLRELPESLMDHSLMARRAVQVPDNPPTTLRKS
ncbi:hypothetical protein DL771_012224 [Monosporascus sp. 5C6A]|nr:hypothetical protein DL771_012224 [Monosporascus sp. 5C6A]